LVGVGDIFQNPDLANTLDRLAQVGIDDFYNGTIADEIIAAVTNAENPLSKKRGVMKKSDLQGYKAVKRLPIRVNYRGREVVGFNMPSRFSIFFT
jgi:gamma-glutamyltranspeptidase / glutathione hydrolase